MPTFDDLSPEAKVRVTDMAEQLRVARQAQHPMAAIDAIAVLTLQAHMRAEHAEARIEALEEALEVHLERHDANVH